jgi:hypothetical protein
MDCIRLCCIWLSNRIEPYLAAPISFRAYRMVLAEHDLWKMAKNDEVKG